jgi:putative two-component system response regulator
VCDVYDALRSERPYKGPWTHEEALRAIREGSESQFDPEVVAAFLDCHECIEGIHATLPDT